MIFENQCTISRVAFFHFDLSALPIELMSRERNAQSNMFVIGAPHELFRAICSACVV